SLGLDAGQLQFLGENLREFIEREIDLHDVLAWVGAALGAFALALADDIALFAVAGAHTLRVIPITEMWQLDPAHGNADQVLALLADQLALGEKFAQILTNPA